MDQFNYDPIGRITGQADPERKYKSYLYDPAGDLLKTRVQSENEDWSRAGEYEGISYRFDRVGNLVERAGKLDKTEFVWDAYGRLIESVTNGKKTSYQYDPLGRRISKETEGVVTRFYWDGDALLGELRFERKDGTDADAEPACTRWREWIYYAGSFEPLAMVEQASLDKDKAQPERIYYYANDPNGCPTRLLDETGKVVWAALYDAWGKVKKLPANEVDQPLRLQGQYYDAETGLCYNRFRYYCAAIGSFVSQDPLGLVPGENVYSFGPNVHKWIDPLGLCKNSGEKMSAFTARQIKMLEENVGYNVSPESWFSKYDYIGRNGTFITDKKAIQDAIGEFKPGSYKLDAAKTAKLETALGLQKGSLADGFRITEVKGIRDKAPRSPLTGNEYFLGGGKGLPGGGPEMVIDPIPTGR